MAGDDRDRKGLTAAVLAIGDEVLSGRTRDANIQTIAQWLGARGVRLAEARIVSDERDVIAEALNALRRRCDYVFTTGGIGPTHDDITADSVAAAFGVAIEERADALQILLDHYGADELTPARRRMARIPAGARLIENPVSAAPGFQIENVFVMAGVPKIMAAMLNTLDDRVARGPTLTKRAVTSDIPESVLSDVLRDLVAEFPDVSVGSYPYMDDAALEGPKGVTVLASGFDEADVAAVIERVAGAIRELGGALEFKDRMDD